MSKTPDEHVAKGEKYLSRADALMASDQFKDLNQKEAETNATVASAHFLAALAKRK